MPSKSERIDVDVGFVHTLPDSLPAGLILVHNEAPPGRQKGAREFRVWLDGASDRYERCRCGWANGREHYRVKTTAAAKANVATPGLNVSPAVKQ